VLFALAAMIATTVGKCLTAESLDVCRVAVACLIFAAVCVVYATRMLK
jgi:hypothetical protein